MKESKKFLITLVLTMIFLLACSKNSDKTENTGKIPEDKNKVISSFIYDEDLKSYTLKTESLWQVDSSDKKEKTESMGLFETIKDEKISHIKWENDEGDNKSQNEEFIIGNVIFDRDNKGKWTKLSTDKKLSDGKENKTYFTGKTFISSKIILNKLEKYIKLTEDKSFYIAELDSNSSNIKEIRKIIFPNDEDKSFFGELTSLKGKFVFRKDNFYPNSFEWQGEFLNKDNNEHRIIRQRGAYDKVNKLEKIEIPIEITNLF